MTDERGGTADIERNKELILRYYEDYTATGDGLAVLEDLLAEDFVLYPQARAEPTGKEALIEKHVTWAQSFSDVTLRIEQIVAEGDVVVVRGTGRARHSGMLMGIPPTGREAVVSFIDIWRLRDGRIVEGRTTNDRYDFLVQLGVIEPLDRLD